MLIYLVCFAISLIFIRLSSQWSKRDIRHILCVAIGLLIPSVIAGLRSETVGTDISVYVKPIYNAAVNSESFISYLNSGWVNTSLSSGFNYVYKFEYGFTICVYVIAKIFHNIHILLFLIHLVIISLVYGGLYKLREKIHPWMGMAVFYFMFYNVSLNMMRQWIAMAMLFYGIDYLLETKIKFFVWVVLAGLFHFPSALFGIFIYFLSGFFNKRSSRKSDLQDSDIKEKTIENHYIFSSNGIIYIRKSTLKIILILASGCLLLLILPTIVKILRSFGITRYLNYISGTVSIMPNQIIVRLPILILLFANYRMFTKDYQYANFFTTLIIIELILSQLSGITQNSWRLSILCGMYETISIPLLCETNQKKTVRMFFMIATFAYLLVYWIYYFVIIGSHATVPYIPFWLG